MRHVHQLLKSLIYRGIKHKIMLYKYLKKKRVKLFNNHHTTIIRLDRDGQL